MTSKITPKQAIAVLAEIMAKDLMKDALKMVEWDEVDSDVSIREQLMEMFGPEDMFYEQLDDLSAEVDEAAQKAFKKLVAIECKRLPKRPGRVGDFVAPKRKKK